MPVAIARLVERFERTYVDHMQGLPVVNPSLSVEAVGFQAFDSHQLGVLITPWFMNLVLLPGTADWESSAQGEITTIDFPSGPIDFVCSHDTELGAYLSAVLFRAVADIADQGTARNLAEKIIYDLLRPSRSERTVTRRDLFTGLRAP